VRPGLGLSSPSVVAIFQISNVTYKHFSYLCKRLRSAWCNLAGDVERSSFDFGPQNAPAEPFIIFPPWS